MEHEAMKQLVKYGYAATGAFLRKCLPTRLLPRGLTAHLLICTVLHERRTLAGLKGLWNLRRICSDPSLPAGAFVECGVARGGCITLMSYISGGSRPVWGFDSFEGMPELTEEDEKSGQDWVGYKCAGPGGVEDVRKLLARFQADGPWVKLIPGWFENTLKDAVKDIGPIAVLRLDNDWYKSTRYCLDVLYDHVVPSGAIVIDDYFSFVGCKKAVDEFRSEKNITSPIIVTSPHSEAYWYKAAQ
jgi:O-methyltransferase